MSNALRLLNILEKETPEQSDRLFDFLKEPENDDQQGWFFYLSTTFNDCLDIKKTPRIIQKKTCFIWTQGPYLNFHKGCIIYDSPLAYQNWREALQSFQNTIQVLSASPVGIDEKKGLYHGSVTFILRKANAEKSGLIDIYTETMSQFEFVRFLIKGITKP